MASARELLEQADALMQRNRRPPGGDEIPELTDAVSDDALPRAGWTVAVEPSPVAGEPTAVDDIPELTEAVEEIEAPSIQEYPDDPDELSRWLQEDEQRNLARIRESPPIDASLDAPRAFVASSSQMPDLLPEAMLRAGARVRLDREFPVGPAAPPAPAAWKSPAIPVDAVPEEIFFENVPIPAAADDLREPDEPIAREEVSITAPEAPVAEELREPEPSNVREEVSITAPEAPVAEELREPEPSIVREEASITAQEALVAEELREPEPSIVREEVSTSAQEAPAIAALPSGTDDAERWNALAEEIRMQVLQRIDIFTDTGLREQLTARLQPVVDRASADLVATINREVGQMLRTYVAEAIEREIEHWRRGGG